MGRLEYVDSFVEFIEERDIDAGALYYTDIEEFSEAEINMENTMRFPPSGPHEQTAIREAHRLHSNR